MKKQNFVRFCSAKMMKTPCLFMYYIEKKRGIKGLRRWIVIKEKVFGRLLDAIRDKGVKKICFFLI